MAEGRAANRGPEEADSCGYLGVGACGGASVGVSEEVEGLANVGIGVRL